MVSSEEYYSSMEKTWEQNYPSTQNTKDMDSFYAKFGIDRTPQEIVDTLIEKIPEKKENMRILEFGCDNGIMLNYFKKYGSELYGVDINEKSIREGKRKFPEFRLSINYGLTLDFEDSFFDVVLLSAVLKHIRYEDRSELYKELKRIGKYFLVFEETFDKNETVQRQGFTFYNSDFKKELSDNFKEIHSFSFGNQFFGMYTRGDSSSPKS